MPVRILCLSAASASLALAAPAPISIDGLFDDWEDVDVAYDDPPGDGRGNGIDFDRLWLADDDRFLFARIEIGTEVDLSENNNLRIYLDADADDGTGLPVGGIGAELEWRPGARSGIFYVGGDQIPVRQNDLRFRGAPTVTNDVFEIAFGRDARPDGVNLLFTGAEVRVVIQDLGGDQLPESGDVVSFLFDQGEPPPEIEVPLERERPDDLRLVTFNVLFDAPWDPDDAPSFERELVAVAPDMVSFQEIFDHSTEETRQLVEAWLPGPTWHAAGNSDCKTVSRYPIRDSWSLDGNLAVLLDTGDVLGSDLLLINAHLPCCANDQGRQAEVDRIMAFVRDAKDPGGNLDLPEGTPIVITGDLNLVGLARQLETLLTGDIADEGNYGPDFAPDWDGGPFANLISRQTEKRMGYTWRSDFSSFWPGHLDYFIFSDAVLDVGRHFLLYTPEMSAPNRSRYGLQFGDSWASDHQLFCADFRPLTACPADLDESGAVDFGDLLRLLAAWGPCPDCPEDLDGDGAVNFADLLALLAAWGPCA